MRNYLVFLLFFVFAVELAAGCGRSTTTQATTTTSTLCCPALSKNNPPRVTAPTGSTGDLDECAVLRRIQRGVCPTNAQIVCSPARGSTVDRVVLQFLNGTNTVILVVTDSFRAVGVILCTASGYQVLVNNVLSPFTSVSCTQNTLEGPNFVDYYNDESSHHQHKYGYNDWNQWNRGSGKWQHGSHGDWQPGSHGNWQPGSSGDWQQGSHGDWQQGSHGDWKPGSSGQWNKWKE